MHPALCVDIVAFGVLGNKPIERMGKVDDASSGAGFPVGTTLVARWMGQTERTCVVVDRRAWPDSL